MSDLPGKIGPYQVLKRLGAGGMGEVFLAYDERLDRQVAIKRIRSDKDASSERQERFRREARLAAKLNHPAIVHVYDVLATGDVNFIVMEYVEGTNLRRLLDDGPLRVEEAAAIGRDIAEGLAEAHRQGIVHRDLKSENVLVTPSGRAKITDFGIAKRLLRGEDEDSLTAQGRTLGTYRAMSPEQARGEEVDHRSDLFSLGILLYEALTGKSPFEAENELAMVHRIIHDRQRPVREMNPEVPENLSLIVDHLLEKEPFLRPRNAKEVAVALAASAETEPDRATTLAGPLLVSRLSRINAGQLGERQAGPAKLSDSALTPLRTRSRGAIPVLLVLAGAVATVLFLKLRPPEDPLYVAVLAPEVAKPISFQDEDLVTAAVRTALVHGLVSLRGISVKANEEVDAVSGPLVRVAQAVAADELVISRLHCRPETCRITLSRLRGADGSVRWTEGFEVPTDDFYLMANAVTTQVRHGYADHPARAGEAPFEISSGDLKDFLRLRHQFYSDRDASMQPLLEELAAIRRRAPRFSDVYMLEAEIARYRFNTSRDPADVESAMERIRQARGLELDNPRPLFALFDVTLDARNLPLAEEALAELGRLIPGDAGVLERRGRLLRAQGHPEQGLALLRTAALRNPSARRLTNLARVTSWDGNIPEARASLKQALEKFPDYFDAQSLLAQLELTHGDPQRAADLLRKLIDRSPGLSELSNFGLAQFLLGHHEEAAEIFRQLLENEPLNPFYTLNLADCESLIGRTGEAHRLYQKVLDLIAHNPTGATAQVYTVKAQALAHLGRNREAVAAAQEALRLAPSDGTVAYEVSLVYNLLGEQTSAMVNAERALKLGINPRWFTLPWFDYLRRNPEFQAVLRKKSTS